MASQFYNAAPRASSLTSSLRRKSSFMRKLLAHLSRLKGPMALKEKFVTLTEEYLRGFDEIVIIGDIHGCSTEFKELLDAIHHESPSKDPDRCLKILVGDLVNKGPDSRKVLEYCRDGFPHSVLAVRGNHDEIVLNLHEKFKSGTKLSEKNKWIEGLPSRYISYLKSLPYTISIPTLGCIIVHAGLQPFIDEPSKNTPTNLMITMRNVVVETEKVENDVIHRYRCTKSDKEGAPWATFWNGPEHVYFGHDARRRLQDKHEYATGLDTGCVYGDRLSYIYIKGARKGEIHSIKAKEVYEPTSDTELVVESPKYPHNQ